MNEDNRRSAAQIIPIKNREEIEEDRSQTNTQKIVDMPYLIRALIKFGASDLHLKVGRPPIFRINGKLVPAKMPNLTQESSERIILSTLNEKQISTLEQKKNIDLSIKIPELGRFRGNIFYQRGTLAAAIRHISSSVPALDSLGVPPVLKELCLRPRGLILITGATGTGKSTTLAAAIQHINETQQVHILDIEDPIEFIYKDIKATITQREIGTDAISMEDALLAGLRQDPDIIVLGEMRSRESIQVALTAAETGHLVFATLHTQDAKSTIDRILDVFEPSAQNQIRIQLASTLVAVLSQQLIEKEDETGRALACEIMVKSPAIEDLILKNELEKIPDAITSSTAYYKMQSLNQALEKLVRAKIISLDSALKCSNKPDDLKLRIMGIDREQGYR